MVYNRDSVWLHLYTAYERMIRDAAFDGTRRRGGLRPQHGRGGVPDLPLLPR